MSTPDGLMNEEYWQRVRAAQCTPTDDFEAKADKFYMSLGVATTTAMSKTEFAAAFARSLAHPPTSELVDAAQAVVERWDSPLWKDVPHTGEFINRLRRAIAAHPKEAAPTVDQIMEVVDEWLWSCTPDNQHIRNPLGSKYRTDQPAQDALHSRLTKLLNP